MNEKRVTPPSGGMKLDDIYFVLFRQKWKIIILLAAGIIAAAAIAVIEAPLYQSEAKLLIRYVVEGKNIAPGSTGNASGSQVISTDGGAQNIISSEVEILTSLDLAQQVADVITPAKILAKAGGGTNRDAAAAYVKANLIVDPPLKSSVIRIVFQHPDPELAQPVLRQIIEGYLKKHLEIHRSGGTFGEFLTEETDRLRSQLARTEDDLRQARKKAGVVSLEDTKKADSEQITKIQGDILAAEAELAERQALLAALQNGGKALSTPSTNLNINTNTTPEPSAAQIEEYTRINSRLESLWKKDADLRISYTEGNQLVKENRRLIDAATKTRQKLETENPRLASLGVPAFHPASEKGAPPDFAIETARIAAIQNRVKVLEAQLARIKNEAADIAGMEPAVLELQRKKELEEANLRYFSSSLEQSRIDEEMGAGKTGNISKIQEPSPPFRNRSKSGKMIGLALFGGLAGGLVWAFGIELYLDRSVKRAKEIESKLGMRLFLSIPDINWNGHRRLAAAGKDPLRLKHTAAGPPAAGNILPAKTGSLDMAQWDKNSYLHPFYEALRDRLIGYFEANNLTHNPKLVSVTGCGRGAGISSIAIGLAASLSETGDGNVLLVDMNQEYGAVQQFYKGHPGLDTVLEVGTRESGHVRDNLYVAAGASNGAKLPSIMPKRFANLLPKFKASDFDYIIFDMPPVTQTSLTSRLAGFMDMNLLVVESEKTDVELVQSANALLMESKATVRAVLNKTRTHIPERLHQEF